VNFESPGMIMLHVAAFAFCMSLAFSGFMIFAGLLDHPDHRSNHVRAVPTAGGIGIVAGLGTGMLALSLFYPAYANQNVLGSIMALVFGAGLLGLFDDVYDVNSKLKFAIIILLACACVYTIGPPKSFPLIVGQLAIPYWLGFAGAVLWVFAVTNGVNFMDGSNGLMAGSMTLAFLGLSVVAILVGASSTAVFSFIMATALMGFLPYNSGDKARIFSGDVGSLLVGFSYASASLLLLREAPTFGLLYVGPLLILPFLTDILLTMLMRAKRRENLLAPHKSHLYQRLIGAGHSHTSISMLYGVAAMFVGIIAVTGLWYGLIKSTAFFAIWVSILSMIYLLIHQKLKANSQ